MAINRNNRQGNNEKGRRWIQSLLVCLSPWLLVLLLSSACAPIRPIYKIGLIAPFEGLYRRTGYEALDAMRVAIADSPPSGIDLLPLALDDSADPQRTAQEMLADPAVKAIVGPLTMQSLGVTDKIFATTSRPWLVPFMLSTQGSIAQDGSLPAANDPTWATEIMHAAASSLVKTGKGKLLLAGWNQAWPQLNETEWGIIAKVDVKFLSILQEIEVQDIQKDDTIFWFGDAAEGAALLNRVWEIHPELTFWTGPQGGDPVFLGHMNQHGAIYWATWSNDGYTEWRKNHQPSTPAAYLVYSATSTLIAKLLGSPSKTNQTPWFVQCYRTTAKDTLVPLQACDESTYQATPP